MILLLTTHRSQCPLAQLIRVLDNLHRHLVIAPKRLLVVGTEGFHLVLAIGSNRTLADLEEQFALVNDPEKGLVSIQPIAAEYAPCLNRLQISQLIENKILNDSSFRLMSETLNL